MKPSFPKVARSVVPGAETRIFARSSRQVLARTSLACASTPRRTPTTQHVSFGSARGGRLRPRVSSLVSSAWSFLQPRKAWSTCSTLLASNTSRQSTSRAKSSRSGRPGCGPAR